MENNQKDSAFVNDTSIYDKPIKAVPKPTENIGIDTDNEFYYNMPIAGNIDIDMNPNDEKDTLENPLNCI